MRSMMGLLSVVVLAAVANTSTGAVIALTDTTGLQTSVSVVPGDPITVKATLTLGTGEEAGGTTFFLNSSTSNIFTITARSIDPANPFTDPNSSDAQVLSTSPGLNPTNGMDLGGTTDSGFATVLPGTHALYTFTLMTSAAAPQATYRITVVNATYSNADFDTKNVSSTTYTVNLVPEPVSLAMMCVALGGLALRPRRRDVQM